jgi:hypothetical protein
MKLGFKGKTGKLFIAGFFIITILAVAVYGASNSLKVVSDSHGFKFFVGGNKDGATSNGDPFSLTPTEQGHVQLTVWASPPYPDVYFKAYIDGNLIGEGYGSPHDNVVEMSIPIKGSDYSYGDTPVSPNSQVYGVHQITATAQVKSLALGVSNPEMQNSATLYIKKPSLNEPAQPISEPETTPAPRALLTVKVYDNPVDTFNLVSIFNSENRKIALSQTTLSSDGAYHYVKQTLVDGESYKVQVECAGYVTMVQTVEMSGETSVDFPMTVLSSPNDDSGVAVGELPTGELNPYAVDAGKPWYQFILDFLSFKWLGF